ncbi:hypothetical protein BH09BAC2_BH09BAC2_11110 [soil metagenome]
MKNFCLLIIASLFSTVTFSQTYNLDSALTADARHRDSSYMASLTAFRNSLHTDSLNIEKQYNETVKWDKIKASAIFPVINAGERSGVIPVSVQTFIPDPNMNYKLLFEIITANPDSAAKEINYHLTEIARIINLHAASGIPLKRIMPVIVAHGSVLRALSNNEAYKKQYKTDNPNLKVINQLVNLGAKFIACGQAMAFMGIKKEELLPVVNVSLTAQTALSYYTLKGYARY